MILILILRELSSLCSFICFGVCVCVCVSCWYSAFKAWRVQLWVNMMSMELENTQSLCSTECKPPQRPQHITLSQ